MARGGPRYDEELCAEHDGTLPAFSDLPTSIRSLAALSIPDRTSWKRYAMVAAAGGIGAVLGWRSPVRAALTGLAAARVARSYLRPLRNVRITEARPGRGGPVVFVDGFLTENDPFDRWLPGLEARWPDRPLHRLVWEAQSLPGLSAAIGKAAAGLRLAVAPASAAQAGLRVARRAYPLLLLEVLKNPAHLAFWKADRTGRLLGFLLARWRSRHAITLIGHSLGARVIVAALETLGCSGIACVEEAILLAAPVERRRPSPWRMALRAAGRIVNCYSRRDGVLRYLFAPANLYLSAPAGLGKVRFRGVLNRDVSDLAPGHTRYAESLAAILATYTSVGHNVRSYTTATSEEAKKPGHPQSS